MVVLAVAGHTFAQNSFPNGGCNLGHAIQAACIDSQANVIPSDVCCDPNSGSPVTCTMPSAVCQFCNVGVRPCPPGTTAVGDGIVYSQSWSTDPSCCIGCTPNPDKQCCDGSTPTCQGGGWTCNNVGSCPIPAPPPNPNGCDAGQHWDCSCNGAWTCVQNPGTPIIIDTTGKGFQLTSRANGVLFDIHGDGKPVQVAWTDPASGNAFLALDRDGDGKITSGKELFGNATQQPPSSNPNGFLALAEFDKPANGGNGDGIIDKRDAVFSHLLLWIDENHDGISQPNELHSLPQLGVYSLALKYTESRRTDQFGNQFRYKAVLNPDPEDGKSTDGRIVYDVFLVDAQHPGTNSRPPSAVLQSRVRPLLGGGTYEGWRSL